MKNSIFEAMLRRARRAEGGNAAIEFALLSPILLLFLAMLADLGCAYRYRLLLLKGIAAGAYYALGSAAGVSSSSATTITQSIVGVVQNLAGSTSSATVLINGTSGNADYYYCLNGGVAYMSSTGYSSSTCTDGTTSGKFITIRATSTYASLFPFITARIANPIVGDIITVRVK